MLLLQLDAVSCRTDTDTADDVFHRHMHIWCALCYMQLDEYKEHHDKIWPEVSHALRSVGVTNLSIFLCPDQPRLILYLEYTRAGKPTARIVRGHACCLQP